MLPSPLPLPYSRRPSVAVVMNAVAEVERRVSKCHVSSMIAACRRVRLRDRAVMQKRYIYINTRVKPIMKAQMMSHEHAIDDDGWLLKLEAGALR